GGPDQEIRPHRRSRRSLDDGAAGRGVWIPRPQRRRQDDRGEAAARCLESRLGRGLASRQARRRPEDPKSYRLPAGALPLSGLAVGCGSPGPPLRAGAAAPLELEGRDQLSARDGGPDRPRRRQGQHLLQGYAAAPGSVGGRVYEVAPRHQTLADRFLQLLEDEETD